MGNVDLRAMRTCSLFLSLLMLLWRCFTWCLNETLLEILIWGQWDLLLYFWVSWCFFYTVAPDVQMRLCGKCWFEGNETFFLITESPDAFVTLLHLMFKWDFVGNVDLRAMRPCSLFLSLMMLLWHYCTWWSNETLWEMLIRGQWDLVPYFLVSWCFFDTVAPDDQMRLCGKCWFEGNETMFFISKSPDAFVTLLHLMFKWAFVGNVDLRAMRPCSLSLSLLMVLWHCCTRCSNETLCEMLI